MTIKIITQIANIPEFILIAFLAACLEMAFQGYMEKEMIFRSYYIWLVSIEKKRPKVTKILGLCRYCNGFWVNFIVFMLYFKGISLTILLSCGLNYVFIKLLSLIFSYLTLKIQD